MENIYRNTYNRHCSYRNYLLGEYHLRIYFFFLSLDLCNFHPSLIQSASPPCKIKFIGKSWKTHPDFSQNFSFLGNKSDRITGKLVHFSEFQFWGRELDRFLENSSIEIQ